MPKEYLVAIMAAIIFAGADDNEEGAGYSAKGAVNRALAIIKAVEESKVEAN